jgi:hypothetical protein
VARVCLRLQKAAADCTTYVQELNEHEHEICHGAVCATALKDWGAQAGGWSREVEKKLLNEPYEDVLKFCKATYADKMLKALCHMLI